MLVDINEEEREFLERICVRAEMFARMNITHRSFEKDLTKIRSLLVKFKELDSNLINKAIKGDN